MSFVDLATLAMHRRQEMEARLNVFLGKCDRAVMDIKKLQHQAKGFVEQLNCEPSELRDKFLSCMKQLDEYTYLITDFNLALDNLDRPVNKSTYYMPVHDNPGRILKPLPPTALNLIDALSEPTPSTSKACANHCPSEKIKKKKIPKEDQILIAFSSTSCSSESVPSSKMEKGVQCNLKNEVEKLSLTDSQPSAPTMEERNLPAQKILQLDFMYQATITHVDGLSFWIITEDFQDAHNLMRDMNEYYRENTQDLSLDEMMSLTYCAFYEVDSDCFYRAFFIRLTEEDMSIAEVFLVDIGETCCAPTTTIQPLDLRFCTNPPFARCCHLAGVELLGQPTAAQEYLKDFVNKPCKIKIDDNSSESLGAYIFYPSGESLSDLLVQRGLARRNKTTSATETSSSAAKGIPELDECNFRIDDCPEYDDPLLAVTGYHNRDEMDICKHYKGGPEKTCFKGRRCTKRHVLINPDGWTLDRVPVVAKCNPLPLPAPDTYLRVYVTHVAHFNRFFVQLKENITKNEPVPDFGVVLPPTSLNSLVLDMNSPATRMAYKPLKLVPAPGELVAALYPPDEQWYRARVISSTRADQNVEVMYIDYGNVVWVKENEVRELESRFWPLPAQAVRCALAGVSALTGDSRQWAAAKDALNKMIHERVLQAHVIARDYDEITVELFDEHGFSIAEQLAAGLFVNLEEYEISYDTNDTQKVIVP
ncbi:uncharacterized protein LOC120629282 isoform X2 [Pararge aegeria]|uniref:uncharacterized protein LOC120629282 isoform X2 n=1 Tax=Pararge aegeria TaxID=116150 RepID=UPI0019D2C394|nr:uncharacterized protein LOC120629282 isoform X2 [Pararge aegeria]